jgi:flagellar assembly factor FliW
MKIQTSRFGQIEVDESKIITIEKGLLGFPEARRFVLLPHNDKSPFYWMQSVDDQQLAFVVIHPAVFCADYSFDIPDSVIEELEIEDSDQVDTLVLVTIRKSSPDRDRKNAHIFANLLGPVIVNNSNMKGKQLVLDPNKYPVQFEIPLK